MRLFYSLLLTAFLPRRPFLGRRGAFQGEKSLPNERVVRAPLVLSRLSQRFENKVSRPPKIKTRARRGFM